MAAVNKQQAVLNWSSGKDAALTFYEILNSKEYEITKLLTTVNSEQDRIVMHGVREELLDIQAERVGLPLKKIKLPPSPDHDVYNQAMRQVMNELKEEGIQTSVYGDIFLEDLKEYREQQLKLVDMQGVFPLWKRDTRELIEVLEQVGIEAVIVCADAKKMSKEFLGRKVDRGLMNDLPDGVDPCGENGEFHTFVYNAPYFSSAIDVKHGEIVEKVYKSKAGDAGFYFLDIML